jgi:hypothetical protein
MEYQYILNTILIFFYQYHIGKLFQLAHFCTILSQTVVWKPLFWTIRRHMLEYSPDNIIKFIICLFFTYATFLLGARGA